MNTQTLFAVFLLFFAYPVSADIVNWNETKNVTVQNVTLESADIFNTCIISPDNGSGFDNCTAYILIKNNNSALTLANLDFIHNWNKPAWVRNFSVEFTKNVSYQNVTTNKTRRDNVTNITQRYLNVTNLINYSIAKSGTLQKGQWAVAKISFQKKTWQTVHFNFTAKYNALEILLDPDVSACGTLNVDGATYTLSNDITTSVINRCIFISGNNITFHGNYFNITDTSNYEDAIDFLSNNTVIDNIYINGSWNGIALSGNDNNSILVRNITVTTLLDIGSSVPFELDTYSNVTIENSSFSNGYQYTYLFYDPMSDIKFIETNMSNVFRRIYLESGTFDINNSGIDLRTNISSSDNTFDRQVFSFTQNNLTWNDNNATGGISITYALSNLYASRNYSVYWNGALDHTATTDGSGTLPTFSITLTGATDEIKVIAASAPSTTKSRHRVIIIS